MKVGDRIYCIEDLEVYSPYLGKYHSYNYKGSYYYIVNIRERKITITTEIKNDWINNTHKIISYNCFIRHFVDLVKFRKYKLVTLKNYE